DPFDRFVERSGSPRASGRKWSGRSAAAIGLSLSHLPQLAEHGRRARRQARSGARLDMAEILVIDDDPQMGRLMARLLQRQGHVVHEAPGGRKGMELFRRFSPALVISDIVMPDGEGIETIREMRREAPEMPIVAVSGGSHQSLYLRAAT